MSPESRLRTLIESDNFMKNFKIEILSEKNGEVKLKIFYRKGLKLVASVGLISIALAGIRVVLTDIR